MNDLLNTFLNVTRLESGTITVKLQKVNVKEILDSILNELNLRNKTGKLSIRKNITPNLPPIVTDPNLLRIILQNLLSNAVKYTPQKGEVKIEINKHEKELILTISDTGIGVPNNVQKKIFTKFFRAKNAMEKESNGTGLGLYIVQKIVDKLGGKIWFNSVENKGTAFHFNIPIDVPNLKLNT